MMDINKMSVDFPRLIEGLTVNEVVDSLDEWTGIDVLLAANTLRNRTYGSEQQVGQMKMKHVWQELGCWTRIRIMEIYN